MRKKILAVALAATMVFGLVGCGSSSQSSDKTTKANNETQANINSFEKISKIIDEIGMDRIAEVVSKRDGVEAQRLVLDMLK